MERNINNNKNNKEKQTETEQIFLKKLNFFQLGYHPRLTTIAQYFRQVTRSPFQEGTGVLVINRNFSMDTFWMIKKVTLENIAKYNSVALF